MFEWDPRKADLQHSQAETRFLRIGQAMDGRVLVVAYTFRGEAMPKRSVSSARVTRAAGNERRTTRKIDFSDIPDSSPEQLKAMRRVGRPPLGDQARQLIAIRVDAQVLDQFRKEAKRRKVGYQTLINEVLAQHVQKDVA